MAIKKKRSAAQKAATKKLIAYNKKRRAKKATPKRRVTKKVTAKRRVTKKTAVRRSNPDDYGFVIAVEQQKGNKTGYWTGKGFDTDLHKAVIFRTSDSAKVVIKQIPISSGWNIGYMKFSCRELMRKKK